MRGKKGDRGGLTNSESKNFKTKKVSNANIEI